MVRTPIESRENESRDNLTPVTDETRWASVVERDAQCDGSFVYSVATTGVYCRPSCPARTAKRVNVRFHETCAEAEAAGFRPCKRCKPTGNKPRGDRSGERQPETS